MEAALLNLDANAGRETINTLFRAAHSIKRGTVTPDLVLSDWNMPNMSGLQLLEALGAAGIHLKFGFITTEATTDMRAKATGAGAKFQGDPRPAHRLRQC